MASVAAARHRAQDSARDTTADRLVAAAERLIGEQGLDATSVRAVCADAGANVAAVHYHFGSKDALVDAVLARRMADLTGRRRAMLAPLVEQPRPSTRAVVDALVRPLAEFARDPAGPGRSYVRFLAAVHASEARRRIAVAFAPQYDELAPLLARSLPDVDASVLSFRIDLVSAPMLHTLADPEHALRHWTGGVTRPSYDVLVDALVDAVTGAITGGSP